MESHTSGLTFKSEETSANILLQLVAKCWWPGCGRLLECGAGRGFADEMLPGAWRRKWVEMWALPSLSLWQPLFPAPVPCCWLPTFPLHLSALAFFFAVTTSTSSFPFFVGFLASWWYQPFCYFCSNPATSSPFTC